MSHPSETVAVGVTQDGPASSGGTEPNGTVRSTASFFSSARLVAEREIMESTRSKGFWITFALFMVGILGMAVIPGIVGGPSSVAVVGADAEQVSSAAGFEIERVDDRGAAEDLVMAGDVDAAIVPDPTGESPNGMQVVAKASEPNDVMAALSTPPPVELLEPAAVSGQLRYFVSFSFGLIFFMLALMFGTRIAQSVVTEKQTRVVEILVSTIPVRALLAGKLAGNAILVFGQVAVLALLAPVALRIGGQSAVLTMMSDAIAWFVPFFIFGFLLLAAMWAASGALVSRQEDLASSTTLVSMLVMFPYFGVIAFQNNPTAMAVMSYIPFSATVAMPARLFTEEAQLWEPFLSLGILAVTTALVVILASRLYSGSLLQTGGKVGISKAWAQTD